MSVTKETAARSVIWSALENGGLSLLSFLSLIVYSRILSPSDFGLYATAWALVEFFTTLSSMAFHDALVQRPHVTARHFDTAFAVTMGLSVAFAGLSVLAAPAFSHAMHNAKAGSVLGWLGLNFIFSGFAAVITAKQRREFGFRTLAMRSLVGRLTGALIGIACALFGLGIWSLVTQQLLMTLLGTITLWIATAARPKLRFGWPEFKDLASFGAASAAALFLNFGVKRLFVFSCGFFLGANTAGFLNLAFRTIDTFWAVSATAISQVTLPLMSRLQNDPERMRRAYDMAIGMTCTLLYPAFLGLGAIAPEFVELFFGKAWLPSYPYICALSVLVLSQAPRMFSPPLLTAGGWPRRVLTAYAIGALYMAGAIALTRIYSIEAAIAVWAGCELVYLVVFSVMLRRATGITFGDQLRSVQRPFLATAIMIFSIFVCRFSLPAETPILLRTGLFIVVGMASFGTSMFVLDRPLLERISAMLGVWHRREGVTHA